MKFNIANVVYAVKIAAKPPVKDGDECDAAVNHGTKIIWISPKLPREKRRNKLGHEAYHALLKVTGRSAPLDEELRSDEFGEFFDFLSEQLDAQGGNAALMAMEPVNQIGAEITGAGSAAMPATYKCGCCGAPMMANSIASYEVETTPGIGQTRLRSLDCEACASLTFWTELLNEHGIPTGVCAALPGTAGVLYGSAKTEWLEQRELVTA